MRVEGDGLECESRMEGDLILVSQPLSGESEVGEATTVFDREIKRSRERKEIPVVCVHYL